MEREKPEMVNWGKWRRFRYGIGRGMRGGISG